MEEITNPLDQWNKEINKGDKDIKKSLAEIAKYVVETEKGVKFLVSNVSFICVPDPNFGARFDRDLLFLEEVGDDRKAIYEKELSTIIELSKPNTPYNNWTDVQDRMVPPSA